MIKKILSATITGSLLILFSMVIIAGVSSFGDFWGEKYNLFFGGKPEATEGGKVEYTCGDQSNECAKWNKCTNTTKEEEREHVCGIQSDECKKWNRCVGDHLTALGVPE